MAFAEGSKLIMTPPAKPELRAIPIQFHASELALLDRAAALRGVDRHDFLHQAAIEAAVDALSDRAPLRMNEESFAAFLDILARPAKPIPPITEMAGRPAPWENIPRG